MDKSYDVPDDFDIIFCRNVLIYFDKKTQEEVVRKQCLKLKKDGYFFLGHSESILGMDLPLKQIKPTVYRKI
jgi:chemotaxis protein methyltransferase CheR